MDALLIDSASSTRSLGQEERLRIDVEAVEGWVAKGAQVSPRVQKLIKEYQAGAEATAA